jgi:hypothetical protein
MLCVALVFIVLAQVFTRMLRKDGQTLASLYPFATFWQGDNKTKQVGLVQSRPHHHHHHRLIEMQIVLDTIQMTNC